MSWYQRLASSAMKTFIATLNPSSVFASILNLTTQDELVSLQLRVRLLESRARCLRSKFDAQPLLEVLGGSSVRPHKKYGVAVELVHYLEDEPGDIPNVMRHFGQWPDVSRDMFIAVVLDCDAEFSPSLVPLVAPFIKSDDWGLAPSAASFVYRYGSRADIDAMFATLPECPHEGRISAILRMQEGML